MVVDNFDLISSLLEFSSDDDCYFLQIIKRKKENPEIGSNNYVVKTFFIDSVEKLLKLKEDIILYCTSFNARAYINLNKRSYKRLCLKQLALLAEHIEGNQYSAAKNSYTAVAGRYGKTSKWLIDIDYSDKMTEDRIEKIINNIYQCVYPNQTMSVIKIPTLNGIHLIVTPFDLKKFYGMTEVDLDLHKNNPTILYAVKK